MLIQDLRLRAVRLDTRAEGAAQELGYRHPMGKGPDPSQLDHLERIARVAQKAADTAWRIVSFVPQGAEGPAPTAELYATELEAEVACKFLRQIIEAAENSNQAGESAVVIAANAVRLRRGHDKAK